jgi:hypothetical protein
MSLLAFAAPAVGGSWEKAAVSGQGGVGTTSGAAARILRTNTGLSVRISMPTPVGYRIPATPTSSNMAGHPAAFTGWAFIFFNPDACVGGCGGDDLMRANDPDPEKRLYAGGFNVGGHVVGGPNLTLSGHVNRSSRTFGGSNAESLGFGLSQGFDLADAEIHVAVAPHGVLDPALLPAQISTPAGDPTFWWSAQFLPLP